MSEVERYHPERNLKDEFLINKTNYIFICD